MQAPETCLVLSDQEILRTIEQEYFDTDAAINVNRFELSKVPASFGSRDIVEHCQRVRQQHHVISKRVLLLVLQKQSSCKQEIDKVVIIQRSLLDSLAVCRVCRSDLTLAMRQFTASSLQILYYCRKRKILESLLKILHSIKTVYRMKDKLKQLLKEENYSKAICLISECQRATETHKQYRCIVALCGSLRDTLEQVEENLDTSLAKICTNFDVENYVSILVAYNFLGKFPVAVDQLHMHFTAAIHQTAFNSVLKYIDNDNAAKKQYSSLCESVPVTSFLPCLVVLCRSLLVVLKSYHLIIKWHHGHNFQSTESTLTMYDFLSCNQQFILQKFENSFRKIFNDVENKIIVYLNAFDLRPLKFEEFMQALGIVERISTIGGKTCNRSMTKLNECTKQKVVNYFVYYHASRLDELKIFLENDGWKLCPIKSTFQITQLREFKTFKHVLNLYNSNKYANESTSESRIIDENDWSEEYVDNLVSPSDIITNETADEDILRSIEESQNLEDLSDLDSDDDGIPEELKHEFVDDANKEHSARRKSKHSGPVITNVTLSALRICGNYLQVIQLFKEVAGIITEYMIQIFDLYFYSVYYFFTADIQVNSDSYTLFGTNLKRTLSRIKDSLINDGEDKTTDRNLIHKVRQPQASSIVDLNDASKLYGLTERIVAIESLIFLGQQYETFQFYLNSITLQDQEKNLLNQFYLQTIPSSSALRKPIYMAAISRAFNVPNTLNLISKVNWELEDVSSQHSSYVDSLVQEIREFKRKLTDIQNHVPMSKQVHETIWETMAHLLAHTLVDGFSGVRKCSPGGRALMQLDSTVLVSQFEAITLMRPMPHQEYVASYIKAYYLPEQSVEPWIKTHSEYSAKHLGGLIACMFLTKRVKQRLLNLVEDQRFSLSAG